MIGARAGQFILTGSASPARRHHAPLPAPGESGVCGCGPMSLYESGISDGAVSLKKIFDGSAPSSPDNHAHPSAR